MSLPTLLVSGLALIDVGDAMRELSEVKDALDMEVKQNFIDPMQILHEKDLKEIQVGLVCGFRGRGGRYHHQG